MGAPVVFRADTTVDIWAASVVMGLLPGRPSVIAHSTDKDMGYRPDADRSFDVALAAYPWDEVVDITGLPMNPHWLTDQRANRARRLLDTRASVRMLREALRAPLGRLSPGGARPDVYVTCLTHPDVRAFAWALAPRRPVNYTPHSFLSPNVYEITSYAKHAVPAGRRMPRASASARVLGRVAPDAGVPDVVPVATAYSFGDLVPWAAKTVTIVDHFRPVDLLPRLPHPLRTELTRLRETVTPPTGLLILDPEERDARNLDEVEILGLTRLVAHVAGRESLRSLVVKPHPRNGGGWVRRVSEALARALPRLQIITFANHGLPIEIAAPLISFTTAMGLTSTSLVTLHRFCGVRVYCAEELALLLRTWTPAGRLEVSNWFEAYRSGWTVVDVDVAG